MFKKIIFLLIGIFILLLLYIGNFFYNIAVNSKTNKDFLNDSLYPDKKNNNGKPKKNKVLIWAENIYEKIKIKSFDDLNLNAYFYNNDNNNHKYALIIHGYNGNALEMVHYSKYFYDAGYSIISPDCRGLGESEGDYIAMGWHDRLDVLKWIDYIIEKDPLAKIVLFGVSMGGATVMMTSGEDLPNNVKVLVEDCGYTSINDIFKYQIKALFNLPSFPIVPISSLISKFKAGYFFYEGSSIKQLQKNQKPILFIHGDKDFFVPFSMLDKVYNATNSPKEKYIVKNAGHAVAAATAKDKYWNKVFGFINEYID